MPIQCPQCGFKYDVLELSRTPSLKCRCGYELNLSMLETFNDFLRYFEGEEEQKKANIVQKDAQLICKMILDENCPDIDIEIAMNNLAEKVKKLFPDKIETYEMIYVSRFKRLWNQFRSGQTGPDPSGQERP